MKYFDSLRYKGLSLALMLVAFVCANVSAQKFEIKPFTISNYEVVKVPVNIVETPDSILGFGFTCVLPEQLEFVGQPEPTDRLTDSHNFQFNPANGIGFVTSNYGEKPYIQDTDGVAFYLPVKVKAGKLEDKVVTVNMTGLSFSKRSTNKFKPVISINQDPFNVNVTLQTGTYTYVLSTDPAELSMTPGETKTVTVNLDNSNSISGFQLEIVVPEGFSIRTSSLKFSDRCADNFIVDPTFSKRNDGVTYGLVAQSVNTLISANSNEGAFFSFDLTAPEKMGVDPVTLVVKNLIVTPEITSTTGYPGENCELTITNADAVRENANLEAYNAVIAQIDALQEKLDAEKAKYSEEELEALKEEVDAAQAAIDAARAAADEALEAVKTEGTFEYTVDEEGIQALIDAIGAKAEDLARQKANQEAYDAVMAKIDALQTDLDAKKGEYSEEMQAKLTAEITAAQDAIDAAKTGAAEALAAVAEEGTFEYTLDEDGIKALIAKIAEKAEEIENAQQALDEANTAANGTVEALQNALDAALSTIADEYADVAEEERFSGADIQASIDALKKLIEDAYADGTLVDEEVQGNIASQNETITAAIDQLVADAKAAHEALAAQAALDKAQADANVVVGELEAVLTAALNKIAEECPLVKDNEEFNGENITSDIEALKDAIAAAYEDGTLAEKYGETVTTPAEAISAAIAQLVADAQAKQAEAAQAAEDEAKRQEANTNAYNEVLKAIQALQDKYDAADAEYTDEDLADVKKAALDAIDKAKEDAEAALAAVADAGEFDYTVPTDEIEALIAAIATKAGELAAQKEALANAKEALETAKTNADEAVEGLNTALETAMAEIAEKYPNAEVSDEAIKQLIADLQAEINGKYNEGKEAKTVEDVNAATEAINNAVADNTIKDAIENLVAAAKDAQDAYDQGEQEKADQLARDNAYNTAKAVVDGLKEALDAALAEIAENCADVKDQFTGAEISADIDAMMAAIQAAYDGNKTPEEIEAPTATSDEIAAAIAQLIEDAKAAQKAVDDAAEAAANLEKAYKDAKAEIVALNKALAEALQTIETECPDVKHLYTGSSIQAQINVLKDAVEEAYAGKNLYDDYADIVTAEVAKINGLIEKLVNDAKAAQQAGDDEKAAEQARKDAYENANGLVAALQDELKDALAEIAKDCADVKDNFTGEGITADINSLKADIEAAYADKTILDKEETFSTTAGTISAAIKQLVADAKAAQGALADAKTALETAKTNADAAVEGLNAALETAMAEIAEKYPNAEVSDEAIKQMIADLQTEINGKYSEGKAAVTVEDVNAATEAINSAVADNTINAEIEKLLSDAKDAQEAYDKGEQEKADQIARDNAYNTAKAVVDGLKEALEAALAEIAENCADVKDQFTGAEISADIDAMMDAIQAAYDGNKTPEEIEAPTATSDEIAAAIAKLIEDAKDAQKAVDEEKENAEKALKEAKETADAAVKALKEALAAALDTIATQCADVKDQFTGAEINTEISNLESAIAEEFIAGTLADNYDKVMAPEATIEAAIKKLVEDAKAAQAKVDAANAALKAIKEKADSVVLGLEKALQAALDTIAEKCADVKDLFPGSEITARIEALKAAIQAAYENKTLGEKYDEVMTPVPSIEDAIAKLVADAKEAQAGKDAEKAAEIARQEALTNANALIGDLNKALADALTTIATECADVKDDFKGEKIAADIAAMEAAIKKAYEDKSIVENYNNLVAPAKDIEAAIKKLVEDAKAAQAAFDAKAALEKARANANAQLASLDKALADALKTIADECPDVAHLYPGTGIAQQITVLRNAVNTAYENKTLADKYDEIMAPAATIVADIQKMIDDAKAAQKKIDDAETARQKFNAEAYEADLAAIAELEAELAAAKIEMDENYPDYNYTDAYNKIVAAIAALKARVEKEKDSVANEGKYSYSVDKLPVELMIENMLTAAKATGIEDIMADGVNEGDRIFTLDGKQVPTLQHGKVNIIVKADGTTRKVFVK